MKRGKILYIGNKLSYKGSTVTSIETLGSFLQQEGWQLHTASSKKNKIVRLLHMCWKTLSTGKSADCVLIDTYSTQNFYYAVTIGNICRLLKIPYIPILRGGNLPERLEKNWALSYKLFNGAYKNVAPSMYLKERFEFAGFKNVVFITNTIKISNYPFRKRSEIKPKLLWVRSFAEIYNPMLAVTVLKLLSQRGINAELCMIGPDKDGTMANCREFAEKERLNLTVTGMLTKSEWIKRSEEYDIFLNTTNFDNTPVSVIEAMALGLPVVSTDVGGMPYLIDNEMDGLLVPPDDPDAFVHAVTDLLADRDLVAKLAQNARQKVEGFDWTVVSQQWNSLLEAVNKL